MKPWIDKARAFRDDGDSLETASAAAASAVEKLDVHPVEVVFRERGWAQGFPPAKQKSNGAL